jgi:RimJ/RimL family protein N-acetyltransferase
VDATPPDPRPAPTARVHITPWTANDIDLLRQCVGDPAMMTHLGGPDSEQRIAQRQARYEQPGSRQFRIVDEASGENAGWVGYWEREWQGEAVFEIGWAVIPAFQRRGIAGAATQQAIALAGAEGTLRHVHAYPGVGNGPSNAVCRTLGFTLLGESDFEYPPGSSMRCNDWRLELL